MLLFHQLTAGEGCPPGCRCSGNTVDCSYSSLGYFPPRSAFNFSVSVLNMAGNKVDKLDPSELVDYVDLQNISFRNNDINNVSGRAFQGLAAALGYLDLSENRIDKIPKNTFAYVPDLKILMISHNTIVDLEVIVFGDLKNLEHLDLSMNSLAKIHDGTFNSNEKLKYLSLNHNHIQSISGDIFKMQNNLRHLDLSHNKIRSIDQDAFTSLTHLRWLSISHNKLKKFSNRTFECQKEVEHLSLSTNKIKVIKPYSFANCISLQNLSITDNSIEKLEPEALCELRNLRHLDLSDNRLTTWNPEIFTCNGSEKDNTADCLKYKSLNYNLKFLNLDNNTIISLDQCVFVPTSALQVIDLKRNNLSALNCTILKNFNRVDVSFNNLTKLGDQCEKWLKENKDIDINFTGNPWTCGCEDESSNYTYKVQFMETTNKTLCCGNPKDLEKKCVTTTDATTTTTNTTNATNATTDVFVTKTNFDNMTNDSVEKIKEVVHKYTTKASSFGFTEIFVIVFAISVSISTAWVILYTRRVRRYNLNHRWWEDSITRKELMSE